MSNHTIAPAITTWAELRTTDREVLNRAEVARLLAIDPRTVDHGIGDGTIPAVRIGRRVRSHSLIFDPRANAGVALEIGVLAGERHDHDRSRPHAVEPGAGGLGVSTGGLPEAGTVGWCVEHQTTQPWVKPALGCPLRTLEHSVDDGRIHRVGRVAAPVARRVIEAIRRVSL